MDGSSMVNELQLHDATDLSSKSSTSYQSFLQQLNQEHDVSELYHSTHQSMLPADTVKDGVNGASSIQVYNKNPPTYIEYQSQQNLVQENSRRVAESLLHSEDSLSKYHSEAALNIGSEISHVNIRPEINFNDKLIWCEECGCVKATDCPDHPPTIVLDKKIISLARQTLPSHFSIVSTPDNGNSVLCNKRVKKCTRFGPLIGVKVAFEQIEKTQLSNYIFRVFTSRERFSCLDISDESISNWMMFIRPAQSVFEQNLVAYQHNGNIYFSSTCNISAGEELRMGYSESYALLMGVKTLKQSGNLPALPEKKVIFKDGFPCDTCEVEFIDFELLDVHVCPNEIIKADSNNKGGRTRNKRKGKPQKLGSALKTKITARDKKGEKVTSQKVATDKKYRRSEIEIVTCKECVMSFKNQRRLDMHMYVHTGEYPYKCNIVGCSKTFNTKFKRDRHILTHGSRDFTCAHCGKAFARKDNLNAHLVVHDSSRQLLQCSYEACKKIYSSKVSFNVHIALHKVEDEGALSCSLCHRLYDNPLTLIQHIKVHAGSYKSKGIMEKKFKCTTCDKRFFACKDRDRHLLTHTKEKNFECNICSMKFSRSDHLKRHHLKIHPDGQKTVKTSRGRGSKVDQLSELSTSDFTRSIQQLFAETNLMDSTTLGGAELGVTNTTVQITPMLANRSMTQSDSLGFTSVQNLTSGHRTGISITNSNTNQSASNKQLISWQQPSSEGTTRYVISGDPMTQHTDNGLPRYYITSDSVRIPSDGAVTTYLLPSDTSQAPTAVNLDSLARQSSLMMDSSHALPSDSLSNDFTADGMKVLSGLTPIFHNTDGTATDSDLIPIVYQSGQQ